MFTVTRADFDGRNAVVVGLSGERGGASGRACGVGCTIDLLVDAGTTFLGALGVGQSEWNGTRYWDRTTFLVDPKGVVRKVYTEIDPNGHEKVLLEDLDAFVRGCPADGASAAVRGRGIS